MDKLVPPTSTVVASNGKDSLRTHVVGSHFSKQPFPTEPTYRTINFNTTEILASLLVKEPL